jgi:hypothetical protein
VWLISKPMDPTHSIDHAALDPMHIIFLRPLKALLKIPVAAIKSICMETNFNHGYRTPFMDQNLG